MRVSYRPETDSLYIRFVEGPAECEVIRLNKSVAVNLGANDAVVGVEILDASVVVTGISERAVTLENLSPA